MMKENMRKTPIVNGICLITRKHSSRFIKLEIPNLINSQIVAALLLSRAYFWYISLSSPDLIPVNSTPINRGMKAKEGVFPGWY